jgi:hypothetical protein
VEVLANIVPITVLVAVTLFFVKEIVEAIRRYSGDFRKKGAFRTLLARECELNHWTIKSIKRIVETIRDESAKEPQTKFSFIFPRSGKVLFRCEHPDAEWKSGSALAEVHKDLMGKYLLDVATLDKKLFASLQVAYDALANLEHVRESLIYFVAPEDEQDKDHLYGFVGYALSELDDIYGDLAALYLQCTGQKLETHRLR